MRSRAKLLARAVDVPCCIAPLFPPLRPAADAVVIDSTSLTLDQVIERVEEIIQNRLKLA